MALPANRRLASRAIAVGVTTAGVALGSFLAGRTETSGAAAHSKRPPDIVIVLIDTLRADRLGMYGYARDTSPHLDEFAAGALLFAGNRSQAACTFPSVNSLLTSRDPYVFLGQKERRFGLLPNTVSVAEILRDRGYFTAAVSASSVVRKRPSHHNRHGGFDAGFEVFDDECLEARAPCVNRAAAAVLAAVPSDQPLFLYVHYMEPHAPYRPAAKHRTRWLMPTTPDLPTWVRKGDLGPLREHLYNAAPPVPWSAEARAFTESLYDAEIASVDDGVAALFAQLDQHGRLKGTLIAFVADHGEEFMEHGHIFHCRTVFDSSVRTPLVLSLPGVPGGRRFEHAVQNLDVVPTLLDYAGFDPGPLGLEGRSLRSLIDASPRASAEGGSEWLAFSLQHTLRSVTDGRHKVTLDLATQTWSLYDLIADPGETTNVLENERRVFRRLQEALLARARRVEDGTKSLERAEESFQALRALGYL